MRKDKQKGTPENLMTAHKKLYSIGKMFALGAMTGGLDVFFNYPLVNATIYAHDKNLMRNLKLKILYRGFVGSAFCMIPATTVQFGIGGMLMDNYEQRVGAPLSIFPKAACSAFAGAASAFIVTPQEHVLTKLKETPGVAFTQMALKMKNANGISYIFTTGLPATMCRFSIGTVCFQTFSPWLKENLENRGIINFWATFFSCIFSGGVAAVATQPADRIKYWQQIQSPRKLPLSIAIKEIYQIGGVLNFFTAAGPRMVRVTSSIGLAAFVNDFSRGP